MNCAIYIYKAQVDFYELCNLYTKPLVGEMKCLTELNARHHSTVNVHSEHFNSKIFALGFKRISAEGLFILSMKFTLAEMDS